MNHWLLDILGTKREDALKQASAILIYTELSQTPPEVDYNMILHTAEILEMVVLDLISENIQEDNEKIKTLKKCASDAYRLYKILPSQELPIENSERTLRMCALAVIGDSGADAARFLRESGIPPLHITSDDWKERTWCNIIDVWLRLIRKQGWEDRDTVLERISALRNSQNDFESQYLNNQPPECVKTIALELICLYHLAKIAEIFAHFITEGVVDGNYQIKQLIESHFDRIFAICNQTQMIKIEPLARLLLSSSLQMIENSIWTVTRAVNSRVTQFVRSLVDRGRGNKAIFDVLPPQRRALAEKGLLGSSRRSVVVCLPTSSGKTLIAQFRILQALNQFEHERGWVVYLVPTKVLVNQVTHQLRNNFSLLNTPVIVEQVSPALEIDSIEIGILKPNDPSQEFRVLVTTPEKFDLILRQGWEQEIGRPLTLVVVDEAHNIQNINRGLRLELLLATINKECQRAQFLLLTPFINNAREVARWLGGNNSDDVSLSIDWQPNDRVIGIVQAEKGELLSGSSFDYRLNLKTVHTTRNTLVIDNLLDLGKSEEIANTYSQVSNQSTMTAVTAQSLKERGAVIVMHQRPDWVWSLAEKLKINSNRSPIISEEIELVQKFLTFEFGNDFPLIELLSFGIGVHHAGLSDEVRMLMEWLFKNDKLKFLVATTTIAQGVNFPISSVVMASHQYPYSNDMPPEDFWNIAGRAGRIGQNNLGIIALVADNEVKASNLENFINRQTEDLNSALIQLVYDSQELIDDLEGIVYKKPEWSSFLQYLAHTYRQMEQPRDFADQIEQVLRGTLGFEKLRSYNLSKANQLLAGIRSYSEYLQEPGQPLKLVDSTGFSLQSIITVLSNKGNINSNSWDNATLFRNNNYILQDMMGVLLKVPELRKNLEDVTGGNSPDGQKLSLIIKDWVNGIAVSEIARKYFMSEKDDFTTAITKCGKNLFGKLAQTASWGLGALLSITGSDLKEEQMKLLRNLPSKVYYGVSDDSAIALRLLGIPRYAATPLANTMGNISNRHLTSVREQLRTMDDSVWKGALGDEKGILYKKTWKVLEGLDI